MEDGEALSASSTLPFSVGDDFVELNVDEEFDFDDNLQDILLATNSIVKSNQNVKNESSSQTDKKDASQKHPRSMSNIELQEKRRRRNISEKLRTKKLNDEFANLVALFSLPSPSNLSKMETIRTAQDVIKDLRRRLERAEAEVEYCHHSHDEKKISVDDKRNVNYSCTKTGGKKPSSIEKEISEAFVFKRTGLPMSLLDVSGVVKFANPSFLEVTGFTKADIDNGTVGMFSMSSKEDLAQMYLDAGKLISGDRRFVYFQKECMVPSGNRGMFHVSMSTIRINDNDGNHKSSNHGTSGTQYFHCTILPLQSSMKSGK